MIPLGQTFFIDEPVGGASGIFLSKIDLFFKTKHATQGIEIQIRTVENGYPTEKIVPYSRVYLPASSVNTSDTGSSATTFTFSTPVFLPARQSYFLAIQPAGGVPDYSIWTGVVGGRDVATGVSITENNPTGTLFLSSDSKSFSPVLNEDIKMVIYRANFTQTSGTIAFTQANNEYIRVSNVVNSFIPGEKVFVANTTANTTGSISSTTNTVTFASHSFRVNDVVYVDNGNSAWIRVVTANTSTTITLNANNLYTNATARVGLIRGSAAANTNGGANTLYGLVSTSNSTFLSLYNSTATTTNNFENTANLLFVGSLSTSKATGVSLVDVKFNSITPRISTVIPSDTTNQMLFKGMSNTSATVDSSNTNIRLNITNELTDYERILRSKSADLANNRNSFTLYSNITTSNNKVSPAIFTDDSFVFLRGNKVIGEDELSGVVLNLSNTGATATPTFNVGDNITQATSNASGTIVFANTSYMRVSNVVGRFATSYLITDTINSNTANVTAVTLYGEDINNNYSPSRYISKRVVLANGQDAEDIKVYLTAYKPQNSNIKVYGKFLNYSDSENFGSKIWSELEQVTPASVISSQTDFNDFVEIEYGLPLSKSLTVSANTNSNTTVKLPIQLNTELKADGFIYIKDNVGTQFTVKQVKSIDTSGRVLTLYSNVAFTSANVTVGKIDGLKNEQGAFRYDGGNNVIRYVSNTGSVFDSYKTFALKIVPVSDDSSSVPHITDMRAIALQI